ncbi:DUF2975 domain-containing protein [Fusibacter ferrireducens]|uniref:DUF2975 domain-containing protein n=1 Tax=Fusibacter ferrireducens TaxID=2785058 RepID=A0ABS0A0I7_9FIRM|nr:DUF2975 domain-containing protein [Fusibacter ferrireducens]MBF4695761.1 DUF2975 domain-containing protein [Fusibacter ferrireducens]
MNQLALSKWLNLIIIIVGLCGLLVYAWIIPSLGQGMVANYPEFAFSYWPWLILILITAVPCYIVLAFGWKISKNIRLDRSFSSENAKLLRWVAVLAAADTGFFFVMNIVFLFLNMNHPGFVLISLIILIIGIAISAVSATLSHLVKKAADLQEQSDLTI